MQYLNLLFTPIPSRSVNVKLSNSKALARIHTQRTHFLKFSQTFYITNHIHWLSPCNLPASYISTCLWQWKSGPYTHSQFSLNFRRWSLHHTQLYTQECISSFMTKFLEGNFAGSLPLAPCPIFTGQHNPVAVLLLHVTVMYMDLQ